MPSCFPNGQSPQRAITQGIATIAAAGELLLAATGHRKADAVARAIEGPVCTEVPASAIQRHPKATVVLDPAAAMRLHTRSQPHPSLHAKQLARLFCASQERSTFARLLGCRGGVGGGD